MPHSFFSDFIPRAEYAKISCLIWVLRTVSQWKIKMPSFSYFSTSRTRNIYFFYLALVYSLDQQLQTLFCKRVTATKHCIDHHLWGDVEWPMWQTKILVVWWNSICTCSLNKNNLAKILSNKHLVWLRGMHILSRGIFKSSGSKV